MSHHLPIVELSAWSQVDINVWSERTNWKTLSRRSPKSSSGFDHIATWRALWWFRQDSSYGAWHEGRKRSLPDLGPGLNCDVGCLDSILLLASRARACARSAGVSDWPCSSKSKSSSPKRYRRSTSSSVIESGPWRLSRSRRTNFSHSAFDFSITVCSPDWAVQIKISIRFESLMAY